MSVVITPYGRSPIISLVYCMTVLPLTDSIIADAPNPPVSVSSKNTVSLT